MNLTDYVKTVSLEDFDKPFLHTATWNARLRTTGGRFFPADGHLDFNPKLYEAFGEDVFRKIVRHELCHYHLYFEGKGYKHSDVDFKELLRKVDGLRYAQALLRRSNFTAIVVKNVVKNITENAVLTLKIRLWTMPWQIIVC